MKKRIFTCISILFLLCILFFVFLFLHEYYGFSIPCPFHKLTGLYCPGCGITRCILSLLKFEFYASFRYNPLVFILLPFFGFYFIYQVYLYITNRNDKIFSRFPRFVFNILIVIVLGFGILRNIPLFSFLSPIS